VAWKIQYKNDSKKFKSIKAPIKLSKRGLTTIAAEMRAATGIKAGDSFKFRVQGRCVIIERFGEPLKSVDCDTNLAL
jgi:bifunctional DNA-binding transcriptional regulator/antitoxin component of YhaV-PrlF toxin-antitoxin module